MSTFPRFTLHYFCTVFLLKAKGIHESESKLVQRFDGTLKDIDRRRPWSHFRLFSLVFARTSRGNRNRINNTRRIFEIHTAHRGVSSEVEGSFGDTITKCYGNIQVASTKASTPQINPRRSIEEEDGSTHGRRPDVFVLQSLFQLNTLTHWIIFDSDIQNTYDTRWKKKLLNFIRIRKSVDTKNVVITKPESSRFECQEFSPCVLVGYCMVLQDLIDFTLSGGINGETA